MVLPDCYTVLLSSAANFPAPNAVSGTGVLGQGQIAAGRRSQLRCVGLGIALVWDFGEGRRGLGQNRPRAAETGAPCLVPPYISTCRECF